MFHTLASALRGLVLFAQRGPIPNGNFYLVVVMLVALVILIYRLHPANGHAERVMIAWVSIVLLPIMTLLWCVGIILVTGMAFT